MSLFDSLRPQQQMNPMQMIQQLRSNPAAMLQSRGLSVPEGMTNPQQIVQHLVNSGQISNTRLQMAMQMLGQK